MIGAKRLTPAVAALLLAAAVAWSQPGADTDTTTTTPQQQSPGADADNGDAARDTTATQTDRSPTDYRSSEEISEDLSVSFPVDI